MTRRPEVSDEQGAKSEPHLPGRKGDPGRTAKDNRKLVNAVLGIAKTGPPGGIFPNGLEIGTPCFNGTTGGANAGSGSGCLTSWEEIPTGNLCCSTPRSCGLTNMPLAQKGGARRGARPFSRRLEPKNPRRGDRPRAADPL